jgi:hypothetical protein
MAQHCAEHDRRISVLEARFESQRSRTDDHADEIKKLRGDIQGMADRLSKDIALVSRALADHTAREDRDRVELLRRQIQQMIATGVTLAAVVLPHLLGLLT